MKKMYVLGSIDFHDARNYYISAGKKRVIVPIKNMHKMCEFSGMTDSQGLIRPGTKLHLVEIETEKGLLYYPNHRFYLKSQNNNCQNAPTFRRNINFLGIENSHTEFKKSFSYYCMPGIIESIAAFGNSGHPGTIIIGVNDYGSPIGIRGIRNKNDQKYKEDDLRNRVKQQMGLTLSRAISFEWQTTGNNKLICLIRVPKWSGEILFIHGNNVYVRYGSTNQLLKDSDLVNFIKNRQCSSQTTKRYPINLTLSSIRKAIN